MFFVLVFVMRYDGIRKYTVATSVVIFTIHLLFLTVMVVTILSSPLHHFSVMLEIRRFRKRRRRMLLD